MCIRPITLHSLTNLYISAWFNPHNIHRTQWYWLMNSEHNGYLFCFKITAELFDILTPAEAGPWDPGQHRGSLGGRQLACIPLPALCPLTWWGMLRRRQSAKHTFQTEHWASQVAHPQFCGGYATQSPTLTNLTEMRRTNATWRTNAIVQHFIFYKNSAVTCMCGVNLSRIQEPSLLVSQSES